MRRCAIYKKNIALCLIIYFVHVQLFIFCNTLYNSTLYCSVKYFSSRLKTKRNPVMTIFYRRNKILAESFLYFACE